MRKQLHVNLFEMNCVSHITHGLWVQETNQRERFNDIEYWTELAQLAEHGNFDSIFIADVLGTYDGFRNGPETAIREGLQIPNNDPLLLVPAMAAVTRNLGFGVTFSTTYEPPFAFARRMSTLDHLTKGRVGWNIVTSYLPNAARNFGHTGEVPHDQRYGIADEYVDVLYKLWEGSWDEDAVLVDKQRRIFADPAKIRAINHEGKHFKVAGPHLSQPSRQRTPLLIQATASPAGIEFAGRHAEVIFTGGQSAEHVRKNITAIRASLVANGRSPNGIKFITSASIITGRSDLEVTKKAELYRSLQSLDGIMAHMMQGIDLTKYAATETIANIIARKDPGWQEIPPFLDPSYTIAATMDRFLEMFKIYHVEGTPGIVADEIERWLDEDGIDGINLIQHHSFDTIRDFINLIIPELRRRGRFRESYTDGETLRERLFGAGHARLPETHIGARYRDPAQLAIPLPPLHLGGHGDQTWLFRNKAAAPG